MAGKPTLGEIAQADHGIRMSKAYTAMLLENPDSVLQQRGRDMQLYDELLRDDQVKPCFQQRRLAIIQSEWQVEPASDSAGADHSDNPYGLGLPTICTGLHSSSATASSSG